jgi:hypothetical protein
VFLTLWGLALIPSLQQRCGGLRDDPGLTLPR